MTQANSEATSDVAWRKRMAGQLVFAQMPPDIAPKETLAILREAIGLVETFLLVKAPASAERPNLSVVPLHPRS
jgi:hypothetical protein